MQQKHTSAPEYPCESFTSSLNLTSSASGTEANLSLNISSLVFSSGKGTYTSLSNLPGRINACNKSF